MFISRRFIKSLDMASGSQGKPKREALMALGQPLLVRTDKRPLDAVEKGSDMQSDIDDNDEYSDPGSANDSEEETEDLLDVDLRNLTQPAKMPRYAERIILQAQQSLPAHAISSERLISTQTEITEESRALAVTWIFRIQAYFGMTTDSLYIAVGYLNGILARHPIPLEELQLMAVTCVWMASKIEEGRVPQLAHLAMICLNQYDVNAFVRCEQRILVDLDFVLTFPTAKLFLRRFLDSIHAEEEIVLASNFFCDLSLFPIECLDDPLDVVALASVCLGKLTLGAFCPTRRLMAYGHVTDIEPTRQCAERLMGHAARVRDDPSHILFQRYSSGESPGLFGQMKLSPDILADF
jgi:cyclin B